MTAFEPEQSFDGASMKIAMKSFTAILVVLAIGLALPAAIVAGQSNLRAGEYIANGGNARLSLKNGEGGSLSFSIYAVSANRHICSLEGEIEENQARVIGVVEGRSCLVSFKLNDKGIEVGAATNGCRDYCGTRADFGGLYLMPKGHSQRQL
ncbi:MAG TPA: hypothetical protein VMM15_41385 [Bradyrhizobium sp.]|nr:hypothetical protein [Bradyrhizobium sp.]